MSVAQDGTGGLTVAGQAAAAATYITVPTNSIVESISFSDGGSPQYEDQPDENGAFHTRLTFEKRMSTVTVVVVGIAYSKAGGDVDGSGLNFYVESVVEEKAKNALRTTITLTYLPTITTTTSAA